MLLAVLVVTAAPIAAVRGPDWLSTAVIVGSIVLLVQMIAKTSIPRHTAPGFGLGVAWSAAFVVIAFLVINRALAPWMEVSYNDDDDRLDRHGTAFTTAVILLYYLGGKFHEIATYMRAVKPPDKPDTV